MDPARWSKEEFGGAQLGDSRRLNRLLTMAIRVADSPAGTVSAAFPNAAEREGSYRLLSNKHVDPEIVAGASHAACVVRCAGEDFVFIPEDGSSLNITDNEHARGTGSIGVRKSGARGFLVMNVIAVRKDGVPLGMAGQAWWARAEKADTRDCKSKRTPMGMGALPGSRTWRFAPVRWCCTWSMIVRRKYTSAQFGVSGRLRLGRHLPARNRLTKCCSPRGRSKI